MKYCTHCGKELFDEAIVCPGCGCSVKPSKTEPKPEPMPMPEEKPNTTEQTFVNPIADAYATGTVVAKKKNTGLIIGIIAAVAVLGIVAAILIPKLITENKEEIKTENKEEIKTENKEEIKTENKEEIKTENKEETVRYMTNATQIDRLFENNDFDSEIITDPDDIDDCPWISSDNMPKKMMYVDGYSGGMDLYLIIAFFDTNEDASSVFNDFKEGMLDSMKKSGVSTEDYVFVCQDNIIYAGYADLLDMIKE